MKERKGEKSEGEEGRKVGEREERRGERRGREEK